MKRGILLAAAAAFSVAAIAGCTPKPPPDTKFADIRFADKPKFAFDVSGIDVTSTYRSPARPPNVEHLFPVRPLKAATQWGRDRLRAAGRGGVVRMVVRRASVVEEKLKRTKGLRGLVTRDQSERYRGVIEVTLDVVNDLGKVLGHVDTRVERNRTVPENITMAGREKVWHDMTRDMMNDLDKSMEAQIGRHLRRFLKN